MSKFKVGDLVMVINVPREEDSGFGDYINGMTGTVIRLERDRVHVDFEKGVYGHGKQYSVLKKELRHFTKLDHALK